MNRWGDPENHSYIIGIFSSYAKAEAAGNIEAEDRGNKYEPEIISSILNEFVPSWERIENEL